MNPVSMSVVSRSSSRKERRGVEAHEPTSWQKASTCGMSAAALAAYSGLGSCVASLPSSSHERRSAAAPPESGSTRTGRPFCSRWKASCNVCKRM